MTTMSGALAAVLVVVVGVVCHQYSAPGPSPMAWFAPSLASACPISRPVLVVGGESSACRWCQAQDKEGGVCTLNTGAGPCGQKYCAVDMFDVLLPRTLPPDLNRAMKVVKHLVDVEIVEEQVRLVVFRRMLSAQAMCLCFVPFSMCICNVHSPCARAMCLTVAGL